MMGLHTETPLLIKASFSCSISLILINYGPQRAVSSAVEHYLDMVGVTGSNPVPPTTFGFEVERWIISNLFKEQVA
jgi:hypothetical protein